MYREIGDHVELCQGDIIANVILSRVPLLATPEFFNENGERIQIATPDQLPDRTAVLTPAEKSNVLILSQCCDCLRRPFLVVCRIHPIEVFDDSYSAKSAKNKVKLIKDSYQRPLVKPDTFYLQDSGSFPKSVAYFLEQFSIPREANEQHLSENRLLRLSQEAVLDLQFRLAHCFGRFATEENYMLTAADLTALEED